VHPVFFGSAATGAGVEYLMASLAELLPATAGDTAGPVSGRVFKIERGPGGEKVAYVRMFSGTVRTRDRLRTGAGRDVKVTAISLEAVVTACRPAGRAALHAVLVRPPGGDLQADDPAQSGDPRRDAQRRAGRGGPA
jgi:ribosomal protection tetracycline resistance protein